MPKGQPGLRCLAEAETLFAASLGSDTSKTTEDQYKNHHELCRHTLKEKLGIPVVDFAHQFSETQHELDKIIPGIHKTAGKEIELIFAFVNKLRSEISKELVSREFKFDKLQKIIEAAQCYEHHVTSISVTRNISKPISKVQTEVFITDNGYVPPGRYLNNQQHNRSFNKSNVASNGHSSNRKFNSKRYTPNSTQICLGFNCYSKPFCTLENNKCKYGRQHKCSICTKPGCRALNHNPQPRAQANLSSSTGNSNGDSVLVNKIINGVNSSLTARKENVEHITAVGSGT